MLSEQAVEDSSRGIYSHRIAGRRWLVGGASNVGCKVLRQEGFSDEELVSLSAEIDENIPSSYDYYPLCAVGERFPVQDALKKPILTPKPPTRGEYLHAILQVALIPLFSKQVYAKYSILISSFD